MRVYSASTRWLLALHEFPKQFAHLAAGRLKRAPPQARGAIDLAARFAIAELGRPQVSLFLEGVQQGIEGPGADPVAVPGQLLDHAQAEDGLMRGVMQHVKPDQSRVEVAVIRKNAMIDFRFRHSITNRDSIWGGGGVCQMRTGRVGNPPDPEGAPAILPHRIGGKE